ncbi:MAG: hypothetical protein EXS13_06015 [Planctomycetes bacterium]|nr:hypothetical protein [Planctomycetota bacterium]
MNPQSRPRWLAVVVAAAFATPGTIAQSAGDPAAAQQARLEKFRAQGAKVPLAVLPAVLKAHVRQTPAGADHALLAAFDIDKKAFVAVRTWIVDRDGELIWSDVQKAGDAEFDRIRPEEPLECCVVVAERVRGILGLDRPKGERDGRMAKYWAAKSNYPMKAELDAMAVRAEALRKLGKAARIAVMPVRVVGVGDAPQAVSLAKALLGSCWVSPVETVVPLDAKPTSNQQLQLWTLARALRTHLEKNPVDADYALFAEYGVTADRKRVMAVDFVICTAKGEWVVADYQNDHHDDYRQVAPNGVADCDALVARRVARLLK